MRYWKHTRERDEACEQDIERARSELASSILEGQEVRSRSLAIANMSSYLAERRERNHFGEALTNIALTPRKRNA